MLRYKDPIFGSLLAVAARFCKTNKDLFEILLDTVRIHLPEEVPNTALAAQWSVMDHVLPCSPCEMASVMPCSGRVS